MKNIHEQCLEATIDYSYLIVLPNSKELVRIVYSFNLDQNQMNYWLCQKKLYILVLNI